MFHPPGGGQTPPGREGHTLPRTVPAAASSPAGTVASGVAAALAGAGCIAAEAEAAEVLSAAGGDPARLAALVARRVAGEPLAWVVGATTFCGHRLSVDPGVYGPRPHSEALAERAVARLPAAGTAVDLCTGSGAVAAVLGRARPAARVIGVDLDPRAVACARANGVEAHEGDLFAAVPAALRGAVDVVVGVLPYVPTDALALLPRDVRAHEPALALDGGPDGLALLRRAVAEAPAWLRPGGTLLLELGGEQADLLAPALAAASLEVREVLLDAEGDARAVEVVSR